MSKFVLKTSTFSNYIYTFAKLNFYLLTLTLLGAGVFGIFPATLALVNNFKKSEDENKTITFSSYFQMYKKIFFKCNKAALVVYLFLIVTRINYEIFIQNSSSFPIIFPIIFLSSCLLVFLISIWIIPIMLNYNFNSKNIFRISLLLSISKLKTTVIFLCSIFLIFLFIYYVPAFALFFAGSLISFAYYQLIYKEIDQNVQKTYLILNQEG